MGQIIVSSADLAWRVVLVALGSAIGGVLRFFVALMVPSAGGLPWATLSVNVVGAFAIGLVSGLVARCCGGSLAGEWIRALLVIGCCGGFTTFSTFSNETFKLLESGQWTLAGVYVGASILAGLTAVFLGR